MKKIISLWIFIFFVCTQGFGGSFPLSYKDDKGYSITIPKKPSRIVIAGGMWPLPSVIMLLEGSAKSIIYMPKASKNAIKNSFMYEIFPQIKHIKDGENENIEELLLLKPDMFICHSANIKLCDAMKKTRIPTIEMSVKKWDYNSYETLKGWLDTLAPILDKQREAQNFLSFTKQIEQDIVLKARKQTNSPKALIIHRVESNKSFSVGGIFANYLLEKSGAVNVVKGENVAKIALEEIYNLNPDIIYINNFNTLLPEEIIQSPLWQSLKAVKNKRVYKFPLGSYRPFAPSLDLPILLTWLYEHNYPQFADSKALLGFAHNFYEQYFGITLTKKQVEQIFTPSKLAGMLK